MRATCVAVTEDFCVFGTSLGSIEYFYFSDWTLLSGAEFRHDESIRAVFPNKAGEAALCKAYVYVLCCNNCSDLFVTATVVCCALNRASPG